MSKSSLRPFFHGKVDSFLQFQSSRVADRSFVCIEVFQRHELDSGVSECLCDGNHHRADGQWRVPRCPVSCRQDFDADRTVQLSDDGLVAGGYDRKVGTGCGATPNVGFENRYLADAHLHDAKRPAKPVLCDPQFTRGTSTLCGIPEWRIYVRQCRTGHHDEWDFAELFCRICAKHGKPDGSLLLSFGPERRYDYPGGQDRRSRCRRLDV